MKTTGVVKFTLDPSRPPKLTPIEKRRLAGLRDAQIDFSGIPETSGVNWKRPGLLVPEQNKHQITLRIDARNWSLFDQNKTANGQEYSAGLAIFF